MTKYKVHPRHEDKDQLISLVPDGKGGKKAVNLMGTRVKKVHSATLTSQEWSEWIDGATQKDLEFVFESGAKDVQGFPVVIIDDSKPAYTSKKSSTKSSTKPSTKSSGKESSDSKEDKND